MKRVLLAWELGDGLGHVARLVKIAERLRAGGHRCLFTVRNLEVAGGFVRRHGFEVLQSPLARVEPVRGPGGDQPTSMTDVLGSIGFAQIDRLAPVVSAWDGLIGLVRPDLVVSDYAPAANLALYGGDVPNLVIGDGFTLQPPELERFQPFRKAEPAFEEGRLMRVLHALQAERRRPAPPRLPSLFAGTEHRVVTLPELDPFSGHRARPAIGPLSGYPEPVDDPPSEDYFAYLSAGYRHTSLVLEGLRRSGLSGSLFLRDGSAADRKRLRAAGLRVHEAPQDMREMARNCRFIVHHGGIGTAETVLALGRPHVLVPRHAEQWLNAASLGRIGVAMAIQCGDRMTPDIAAGAFRDARDRAALGERARSVARVLASRPKDALDHLVSICERLTGPGPESPAAGG